MNAEDFLRAINELPDDVISEAHFSRRKPVHFWYIIPTIAACLVAVIAARVYPHLRQDTSGMRAESSVSESDNSHDTTTFETTSEAVLTSTTDLQSNYITTTFSDAIVTVSTSIDATESSTRTTASTTAPTSAEPHTAQTTSVTTAATESQSTAPLTTTHAMENASAGVVTVPCEIVKERIHLHEIASVGNGQNPATTTVPDVPSVIWTEPVETAEAVQFEIADALIITVAVPCADAHILSAEIENGMFRVSILILNGSEPIETDEATRFYCYMQKDVLGNLKSECFEIVKTDDAAYFAEMAAIPPQIIAVNREEDDL